MTNNIEKVNILGIDVAKIKRIDFLNIITEFLQKNDKQRYIVTPNPEIILEAEKDEEFFYILEKADLGLADGTGLFFAALIQGQLLSRIQGSDATIDILKIAEANNYKVVITKAEIALSSTEEIDNALQKRFPKLKLLVVEIDHKNQHPIPSAAQLKIINDFGPHIIFATFGAPHQEKFIYHNLKKIPSARLAIGVGGAFDFLTGKSRRAPRFMRRVGIEWLWRLMLQPKRRAKRIINAVIIFPQKVINFYFIRPLRYRPNVACLLYKVDKGKIKIFIVERTKEAGHWQIPQGGTDGQDLSTAGAREIREEAGTDKFIVKKTYHNVHSYQFGQREGETNVVCRYSNFKGQKQGLVIAEFTGADTDIKVNFWDHQNWKWVEMDNLLSELHIIRREGAEKILEKFAEYLLANDK